jgi:hypothetical protein
MMMKPLGASKHVYRIAVAFRDFYLDSKSLFLFGRAGGLGLILTMCRLNPLMPMEPQVL